MLKEVLSGEKPDVKMMKSLFKKVSIQPETSLDVFKQNFNFNGSVIERNNNNNSYYRQVFGS